MASMNGYHLYSTEDCLTPPRKLEGADKTRDTIAKISAKIKLKGHEVVTLRDGKGRGRHSDGCWQEAERIIGEEEKKLRELQAKLERQEREESESGTEIQVWNEEQHLYEEEFWTSDQGYEDELERRGLARSEDGRIRALY